MMRMVLVAALAASALAGSAQAQRAPNPFDPNKIYRGLDQLSVMAADTLFAKADANRDGALTQQELAVAAQQAALPFAPDPRTWATFDINKDGVLSRLEVIDTFKNVQAKTRMGARPY